MMYCKTKLNVPLKIPELTAKTNLKTPYSAGNGKRSSILLRSHLNGTACGSQADAQNVLPTFVLVFAVKCYTRLSQDTIPCVPAASIG